MRRKKFFRTRSNNTAAKTILNSVRPPVEISADKPRQRMGQVVASSVLIIAGGMARRVQATVRRNRTGIDPG